MGVMVNYSKLPAVMRRSNSKQQGRPNTDGGIETRAFTSSPFSKNTGLVRPVADVTAPDHFHIMLVAKEQSERQLMCDALLQNLQFNIDVNEALGGEDALKTIASNEINLIIFGDETADMNGLEFLGRLNKKYGENKIPVIEILAQEASNKGAQALRLGAHDYLIKDLNNGYLDALPILVLRIYTERQAWGVMQKISGLHETISDITPSVIYQLSLQGGKHDVHVSRQISELGLSADKWGDDAELHHQLCYEKDRPVVRAALEKSYRNGEIFQCEYRINTICGGLRWFKDRAKLIRDTHGRPEFLRGVMTDISAIKAIEAELMHYRHTLDKMVQEKTKRIQRRLSILESCNTNLCENYFKINQKYHDLINQYELCKNRLTGRT